MAYVNNVKVSSMPGRDGTGPMGFGAKTGGGFVSDVCGLKTKKELLMEEKKILQNKLDEIEKQLEEM